MSWASSSLNALRNSPQPVRPQSLALVACLALAATFPRCTMEPAPAGAAVCPTASNSVVWF
jgi:hypothetical protein